MRKAIFEIKNVSKLFGPTKALDDVNLKIYPGMVMGLIGENGAGKSTIIRCLTGIYKLDTGTIYFNNNVVNFKSIKESQKQGIAVVHQELQLASNLSVAENIFLGRLPNKYGFVLKKNIEDKARKYLNLLNSQINPSQKISTLSIANQQIVEIAKALSLQAKIIILDEPTDALSNDETDNLFKIIKNLQKKGVSFLYVTHRMKEIHQICQDVTILRDGKFIAEVSVAKTTIEKMVGLMIGRDLSKQFPPSLVNLKNSKIRYQFCDFSNDYVSDINFSLKKGEIFALVGLIGSGRTEFARSVIGALPKYSGQIYQDNIEIKINSVTDAIKNKIYYVSENRKLDGLHLNDTIANNVMLSSYDLVQNKYFKILNYQKIKKLVKKQKDILKIKMHSSSQLVEELSGGNQQKVLLAKALLTKPDLLILDEPTRGVDVGARKEIYQIMRQIVFQGTTIIMISSELPEAIGMADRICVFCEGRINGILLPNDYSEQKIMELATGIEEKYAN